MGDSRGEHGEESGNRSTLIAGAQLREPENPKSFLMVDSRGEHGEEFGNRSTLIAGAQLREPENPESFLMGYSREEHGEESGNRSTLIAGAQLREPENPEGSLMGYSREEHGEESENRSTLIAGAQLREPENPESSLMWNSREEHVLERLEDRLIRNQALAYTLLPNNMPTRLASPLKQHYIGYWCGLRRGCPQEGVLSSLLWCVVVDELLVKLSESGMHAQGYADDMIMIVTKFPDTVSELVQISLKTVDSWCSKVKLLVNPDKIDLFVASLYVAQVLWSYFGFSADLERAIEYKVTKTCNSFKEPLLRGIVVLLTGHNTKETPACDGTDYRPHMQEVGEKWNLLSTYYVIVSLCPTIRYALLGLDRLEPEDIRKADPRTILVFKEMLYLTYGTQQVMERGFRDLDQRLEVYLDGVKAELPSIESIVVLNIPSWGAGVHLWNMGADNEDIAPQSYNDNKLEVVALYSSFHIAQLQVGLSQPYRVGQASCVQIKLKALTPVQVDGEPWEQHPAELNITFRNQATVLTCVEYSYFLEHCSRPAVRHKRPNLLNSHPIVLHGGTRSHIAALVVNLLRRWNWEILEHPPYSPDMSPRDFDLFED
ncbi:hypothetical protein ANN_06137 [Periplaneta americana]|uniref:Diacylglycerol kinase accessory domain-containing protein n=1 Tax=Periplaneta americana TaxID=6978 RepID=A0ABQ8TF61_PERAM|nr:hypothetical protein ANN_06137 [Periplaneta americana]